MNLKKIIIPMLLLALVLTGCGSSSSAETKQIDGKDVLFTVNGETILADDILEEMVSTTSGNSAYFQAVLQLMIDKVYPIDDDMLTEVETTLDEIKQIYEDNYGDEAETYINQVLTQQGYSSLENYGDALTQALQYSKFIENYVNNNYDEIFEDYYKYASPRTMSVVFVSMADVENPTEEETSKLEEVKKLMTSSKDFGEIAKDYSDDDSASGSGKLGVVDSKNADISGTYGQDAEDAALLLQEGEISDAIKGENGYYFFKCLSTDKSVIKESIKDLGIDSPLLTYDEYLIYVIFDSYKVKFSSKEIEETITTELKTYLDKRHAERDGAE